jgi:hypothetical protein
VVELEHKGAAATAGSTAAAIVGNCPTAVVKDGMTVPQVACRLGGTLVEHPEHHLTKVLT